MKIGTKLTIIFISIAFSSMLVVGLISYFRAKTSFQTEAFNRLTAVREMKAVQITSYFNQIEDQLLSFSENPSIIEAMEEFKIGFNSVEDELSSSLVTVNKSKQHIEHYLDTALMPRLNKNLVIKIKKEEIVSNQSNAIILQDLYMASNHNRFDEKEKLDSINYSCRYNTTHNKYHHIIRKFAERFGFYDVFLVDIKTGNVVYSVYKELDFATNLKNGPFAGSNFAKCYNAASQIKKKGEAVVVDFAAYIPSLNLPASFIACPIFKDTTVIGVLAFQMPIENINNIMTNNHQWQNVGLGKTGETYIVGEDFTLRNQSRFIIEDSLNYFKMLNEIGTDHETIQLIKNYDNTIGLQTVKTEGTEEALKGITDVKIFKDYRGVPVLSAYKPLPILGMKWVIMSELDEDEAFADIVKLRNNIIIGFLCLLAVVFLVSYSVSKKITKPLKELTIDSAELASGNFDVIININSEDEIGVLADGFRKMQTSISKLVHGLEDTVKERTAEVVMQKDIIESRQKEMLDSINYAKRIQDSVLAQPSFLQKYLNEYFIIFNPKDIVSGDFYWATKTDTHFYLAVCDSTGHGVPGAFMSLLNTSFLNEAINAKHIVAPNEILNYVRERLERTISKNGAQDGMDGLLLCLDLKTKKMTYSAAYNSPMILRNGSMIDLPADKMPIGIGMKKESFTLFQINSEPNDILLIYTDGYADQFGGPKGKKFKYKQLKDTLIEHAHLPIPEQKQHLQLIFDKWKGELEQVDDVCIVGIKL